MIQALSYPEQEVAKEEYRETVLMFEFLQDLWLLTRVCKKFCLAPIIAMMLLLGALAVLTQGLAVAPFPYTLF